MEKRTFLKGIGTLGLSSYFGRSLASEPLKSVMSEVELNDITKDIVPISPEERIQRIQKAQALMKQHNIAALVIEPGAAMDYFTGIQWWRSERLVCVVIPQNSEIAVVCPVFEEPSIRETLLVGKDVRVWQEDENPFKQVAALLEDRGIKTGNIGFEESVRYFVVKGIQKSLPKMAQVSAEPVTRACRMFKSLNELRLLHKANEVTLAAYHYVFARLREGMTQAQVIALMKQAQIQLGGKNPWALALFDEASAFPHGTKQQHVLRKGSLVLMDSGCTVAGYRSDISRTFVFGEPTPLQEMVWKTARKGQSIVMENAKVGVAIGRLDDAVRAFYNKSGYGPDYQLPGLSHRTGHGIGMDIHESVHVVRGESTPLQKGMCFSNEPGIYLPGQFGVRVEDCCYMGEAKAHWFTVPPDTLDKPLGKLAPLPS